MLTKSNILKLLDDLKNNSKYKILKIGLFGSFSRDEQNENSDIDIDVIFDKNNENYLDDYYSFIDEVETKTNRKVHLVNSKYFKNKYFIKEFNKEVIYCE